MARVVILTLFVVLCLVSGCGPTVTIPPLAPEDVPQIEAIGNFPDTNYRIEPGDTLQISYTFHPDFNQQRVLVRPDGKIAANLVGEVEAAGLAPEQLEKVLVERTSDRLRNPEIVVGITEFAERTVYVGGEVGKPGTVAYRRGLTPLQAIIAVGGFLNSAKGDSVVLIRTGGQNNRTVISRKLNLAVQTTDGDSNPLLLAPHDVLFVPRTGIAEANVWVRQHVTELFPFLRSSAGVTYRPQ